MIGHPLSLKSASVLNRCGLARFSQLLGHGARLVHGRTMFFSNLRELLSHVVSIGTRI